MERDVGSAKTFVFNKYIHIYLEHIFFIGEADPIRKRKIGNV